MKSFLKNNKAFGRWSFLNVREKNDLLDFLLPLERSCTAFTFRLRGKEIPGLAGFGKHNILIERAGSSIVSAILDASDGICFPVFTADSTMDGLGKIIAQTTAIKKRFVTLMGVRKDVETASEFFKTRTNVSLDYHQLSIRASNVSKNVRAYLDRKQTDVESQFKVKKALPEDLETLMPLRSAYEKEEVLLDPDNFSEPACRIRFSKTIREQLVLFAEHNGIPAATCCVNADGYNWHQIGGVYTSPEYRSMGLAALLMEKLSFYSIGQKKDLTLFVKKTNRPALKLYRNCGFKDFGEYRISYLERR